MGMLKRAIEEVSYKLEAMNNREIAAYHNICVMNTRMIMSEESRDRNAVHLEACRWIVEERSGQVITGRSMITAKAESFTAEGDK